MFKRRAPTQVTAKTIIGNIRDRLIVKILSDKIIEEDELEQFLTISITKTIDAIKKSLSGDLEKKSLIIKYFKKLKDLNEMELYNICPTKLQEALILENLEDLRRLIIESEIDINDGNEYKPPVILATEYEQEDFLELLLQNNAKLNINYGEYGLSPFHFAALGGNERIIKIFLKRNSSQGYAATGSEDCAVEFIESLIDVNKKTKFGETALCLAVQSGNLAAVEALMEDEDPINRANIVDYHGRNNPLFFAVLNNRSDIAEYLLKKGADKLSSEASLTLAARRYYWDIFSLIITNIKDINNPKYELAISLVKEHADKNPLCRKSHKILEDVEELKAAKEDCEIPSQTLEPRRIKPPVGAGIFPDKDYSYLASHKKEAPDRIVPKDKDRYSSDEKIASLQKRLNKIRREKTAAIAAYNKFAIEMGFETWQEYCASRGGSVLVSGR